jgi:hypothetical protein
MDNTQRAFIYAFLSTVFSDKLSKKSIEDLKNNPDFLDLIGENAKKFFNENDLDTLDEELNIDYTSAFLANSHPVESSVTDAKHQISTGLENPVMNFYLGNGFDINLNNTALLTPDHIAIELGFMQTLVLQEDAKIGAKSLVDTPFYSDFLDFATEFLLSDYEQLNV